MINKNEAYHIHRFMAAFVVCFFLLFAEYLLVDQCILVRTASDSSFIFTFFAANEAGGSN